MTTEPYFSIITPTYNRAREVFCAINSSRAQSFRNFEHIVIDDGGTDETPSTVGAFDDPRIRFVRLERNGGQNAARNFGISIARGRWMVMLDSDMELLPGALADLYGRCQAAAPDVGNVASSSRWDTGLITPYPAHKKMCLDYSGYLTWLDKTAVNEYFNCIRSEVFQTAKFPSGRPNESYFHMGLARSWHIEIVPECADIYHTDSPNRYTDRLSSVSGLISKAQGNVDEAEEMLREYGPDLKQWAPHHYAEWLNTAAMNSFLTRKRVRGLRYALQCLAANPRRLRSWGTLILGMLSPWVLAKAKAMYARHSILRLEQRRA
jgi:glycosyltransferase involved in cell wall biosynthesis